MNRNINDTSMREAFLKKDENQTDKVLEEAQRLVNLYRHSRSFPSEFLSELDTKLLQSQPDVQSALSRIVGGAEVRRYLDFLKEENLYATDETTEDLKGESQPSFVGYLPDPSTDIHPVIPTELTSKPYESQGDVSDLKKLLSELADTRQSELEKLLQIQTETLSKLLEQMDKNRQEMAGHQTDRLIDALHKGNTEKKKYSDIIENASPVFVPDETEGF